MKTSNSNRPGLQLPSLLVGLFIMVGGTVYPLAMTDTTGQADHGVAVLLLWSMAAGFVRGVGFVPRMPAVRMVLSGWACCVALMSAVLLKLFH